MAASTMNRRMKYAALGVALVVLVVAAYILTRPPPPPPPKTPAILTLGMYTEPPILDPHRCTGVPNLGILGLITETVLDLHYATGELLPGLAEKWEESPDATTWTLYLRKNVKFHDGTPFNASAVKFSLERLLDPNTKGPARGAFTMIKSVEAKDEYTVVIKTTPHAPFLRLLRYGPSEIVSPTQVKKLGDEFYRQLAGTGPYKLAEYVKGSHMRLVANDQYWGGRPKIDEIVVMFIPDGTARTMALEAGQIDYASRVTPDDVSRLKTNPNFNVIYGVPAWSVFLGLNNAYGPFRDKRVRQALNYAIDKAQIVQRIYKGLATVMDSPICNISFGYHKAGPYPYDPAKAKVLLKEAGFSDGFETTLMFRPDRSALETVIVESIQSFLSAVGVRVKLVPLDASAFVSKYLLPVNKTDVQMFFQSLTGGVTLDAEMILKEFRPDTRGLLPIYYDNPKVSELHEKARLTTAAETRKSLYKEVIQLIWEDAPCVFLWFEASNHATAKRVHGLQVRTDETIWLSGAYVDVKGSSGAPSLMLLVLITTKETIPKDTCSTLS